ncbi:MAG TPA: TonB-dependent receptor [Caulobacteraceae bacterium]
MKRIQQTRAALLCGAAMALAVAATPAMAQSQVATIDIQSQPMSSALKELARQSGVNLLFSQDAVKGLNAPAVQTEATPEDAARLLLAGTNLSVARDSTGALIIQRAAAPQSGSAAGAGAEVEALIVTAQKREEDIQDVPIAISAFTQEDLTRSQVAGGPDLITQVPNMTFTKTNFSSYSIQIRGIGTQAISATTDPAVAVAFNNTPFIRNRFFEQEFYDLQRVEVLRGPQGTLYGRNATAGVVNIISQKPKFNVEAKASADISNYSSSRIEAMVNIPLVEDTVALRLAGAWTKRDGYAFNEISGEPIDGRDLWSTRASLRFTPNDRLDVNLIWEHFEENDDRLRSGKQLCKKDVVTQLVVPGEDGAPDRVVEVGLNTAVPDRGQAANVVSNVQSVFSQGCERASLYSPDSFQTPNGQSIPYYFQLGAIGLPRTYADPYVSLVQSRDLRTIESTVDPDYRAKSDIGELQFTFDLTDTLSLTSETGYAADFVWSMQDFNRFNTAEGAFTPIASDGDLEEAFVKGIIDENGVFCDPQLGCSSRLVAVDVSTGKARQFSQEFRLASDYEGPFNFSLGANWLRADSEDKYYVFINTLSLVVLNASQIETPYVPGKSDGSRCLLNGPAPGDPNGVYGVAGCVYTDPNPIGSLNDQGHNYFLSKNPYKLISYAVFGEAYYNITDALKVTAGLRWTVDKKEAPRIPSWLLARGTYGYPVAEVIEQEWREPTGRLTVDWKPDLAFTDETLLYASYAHGYKAGGANPPRYVYVFYGGGADYGTGAVTTGSIALAAQAASATRPKTFDPEFVDAFEVGSKNTLADGRVTLNVAAFYYDYKDYQISEIVDRSAFNRNFDATVWGIELESDWRPLENLRLGFKGGYEKTRIADGEQAVDLMDRTAGHEGWSVVRPFPTFASNCILPTELYLPTNGTSYGPIWGLGGPNGGNPGGCEWAYAIGYDPVTEAPYEPYPTTSNGSSLLNWDNYPGFDPSQPAINNGEGFYKQLGGNELPNAPHWTATVTGDYTLPLPNAWLMTLHTDVHWQSQSWWRVFNDHVYDKLHPYFTMNLAAIFTNEEGGWNVMAYVKNVTDETAITGAFLNSDDTGLTTNVFLTEPRLYGLRVTKSWSGGPLLGTFGQRHDGPYPFTVEMGGQVQRQDAPYEPLHADFESNFPDELDTFADAQNRDLDWGDGREVKLTYRPSSGPWTVSAGVRYGKTNSDTARINDIVESEKVCAVHPDFWPFVGGNPCVPTHPLYELAGGPNLNKSVTNWSAATAWNHEEHEIADLVVGRDVGLGALSRSQVSAGLRYAAFESKTDATMSGVGDRYVVEGFWLPGPSSTPFTQYSSEVSARREFDGTGPVLSWEAALPLLGGEDTGRLGLDWSVSGGVLFGSQDTTVRTEAEQIDKTISVSPSASLNTINAGPTMTLPTVTVSRSDDVTVPVAAAELGFSYTVDRFRIGAGYRWERYFDVLDVGYDEAKDGDRTIDGPYFKIAVGFGG